jgi:hypothetical protein
MLRRLGSEIEAGASDACDLVRAAWDSEGAAQPAAVKGGRPPARPSVSSPMAGAGRTNRASLPLPEAAAARAWLLFIVGQLAQRRGGIPALLATPDVLPLIVDVFVGRGAPPEALARCMNIFEGLADHQARELARVTGRRLTAALLDVAAGRPPSGSVSVARGNSGSFSFGSGGSGNATPSGPMSPAAPLSPPAASAAGPSFVDAVELYNLPRRAVALLVMISQDEADFGDGGSQVSLAVVPGAPAILLGIIDGAVNEITNGGARLLARLGPGAPPAPLSNEARLAAGLLELAATQPDPVGPRWSDAAIAAGAVPILQRAIKMAGATRAGVVLSAAACALLKSPDAESEQQQRRAGRRRSQDGAVRPTERALLLGQAWDVLCATLAGVPGGGAGGSGSGAATPTLPAAAPAAAAAADLATNPAPWAVNAVARLLVDHPQAFYGFGAHPGALDALVRAAVAPPHERAAQAAVKVLALLATYVAAAGSADLQQEWVMQMHRMSEKEPARRAARSALEFIEANSEDEAERARARGALEVLAASKGAALGGGLVAALRRIGAKKGVGPKACANCDKAFGLGSKQRPCNGCHMVYCSSK